MAMLGLVQQRARVRGELSRRIGYTNGLHDIFRFARLVTYLHNIGPASVTSLRSVILEREAVNGPKYADGVIDVGRALGFLHKAGNKLMLSDKGYALYAIQQTNASNESIGALLLHAVLESDGEATLNLLDILANADISTSLGELLVGRLLSILTLRESWANQNIESKLVRDIILQELSDSKRRLTTAVDMDRKQTQSWSAYREDRSFTPEQKVERFYSHTVNPRRGWLKDLGYIRQQSGEDYRVTESGRRLLSAFKEEGCCSGSALVLPFSAEVTQLLGLAPSDDPKDLCWQAISSSFLGSASPAHLSLDEYFRFIEAIYPHVKFHVFNEAAIESIYDAMAAQLAADGKYLDRSSFSDLMESTFQEFPDKIYRMRQRHGRSGYIAMKGFVP